MISRVSILFLCAIASKGVEAFAPSANVPCSRRASALSSTEVDISIPYDATVQLAYEASDKSMSYEDFKPQYLEQAVAEVVAKQSPKKHDFALLFDCDGVILETEQIHLDAYNYAFGPKQFNLQKVDGESSELIQWSDEDYVFLQNTVAGGIEKMKYSFSKILETNSIVATIPSGYDTAKLKPSKGFGKSKKKGKKSKQTVTITADDIDSGAFEKLIGMIQEEKTDTYKSYVEAAANPRPGLLSLMDEALADDSIAVGVCSASTKEAAQKVLTKNLGQDRVSKLDVCILGNDVTKKKPDPMIYNTAREKLGIDMPTKCVVVEDATVGLKAAKAAGMRTVITYTDSTEAEDFYGNGADGVIPNLMNNGNPVTLNTIFDPIREAFAEEATGDQFPELLVGVKEDDISIPYDATIQLAYEASDKSLTYMDFKPKYLEQAIQDVISKQKTSEPKPPPPPPAPEPIDISIPYDATVELAYEASDKSLSYEEFKPKFLAEAIQEVIAKRKAREPKPSPPPKKYDFALLFDCDGVILETEHLHLDAYNDAFKLFKLTKVCGDMSEPVEWSVGYYDILQNSIGGGIPKMTHYFSQLLRFESNEHGDPTMIVATLPDGFNSEELGASGDTVTVTANDINTTLKQLIISIQEEKTDIYKTFIRERAQPRPGVLDLMDEALADDSIAVGVCSASTKEAAQSVLDATLGSKRVSDLDVCILGNDVSEKKPSPMIYNTAREKLGIDLPTKCVVVEDSRVGFVAARDAGMRSIITYTDSTADQDFYELGADAMVPDLANNGKPVTLNAIFAPIREAFTVETTKDQFPELLVGMKDEKPEPEPDVDPVPLQPIPLEPVSPPTPKPTGLIVTKDDMGNTIIVQR